jgi:hypothetical protein
VALVFPADIVTEEGTVAADVLLLDKFTIDPPVGAAADKVTVPWEEVPPVTEVGLKLRVLKTRGATVRVAVLDTVP